METHRHTADNMSMSRYVYLPMTSISIPMMGSTHMLNGYMLPATDAPIHMSVYGPCMVVHSSRMEAWGR